MYVREYENPSRFLNKKHKNMKVKENRPNTVNCLNLFLYLSTYVSIYLFNHVYLLPRTQKALFILGPCVILFYYF